MVRVSVMTDRLVNKTFPAQMRSIDCIIINNKKPVDTLPLVQTTRFTGELTGMLNSVRTVCANPDSYIEVEILLEKMTLSFLKCVASHEMLMRGI